MTSQFLIASISIIVILLLLGTAVYYFATSRQQRTALKRERGRIKDLTAELKEWQSRLLLRRGQRPIGQEPYETPPKKKYALERPQAVTKGQLRARTMTKEVDNDKTSRIIKTPKGVKPAYKRVGQQTIEDAKKIMTSDD